MRWVFYSLLLLNAVFFGFQLLIGEEGGAVSAAGAGNNDPSRGGIRLVAEAPEDVKKAEAFDLAALTPQGKRPISGAVDDKPKDSQSGSSADASQCLAWGPLVTAQQADSVISYLEDKEMAAYQVVERKALASRFWVHTRPFDSMMIAMDALNRLKQERIDSFLISEGESKNGLSFGVFKSKGEADAVRERAQGLSVSAELVEKRRSRDEIWVLLPQIEAPKEGPNLVAEMSIQFPQIPHLQKVCKPVAQVDQF